MCKAYSTPHKPCSGPPSVKHVSGPHHSQAKQQKEQKQQLGISSRLNVEDGSPQPGLFWQGPPRPLSGREDLEPLTPMVPSKVAAHVDDVCGRQSKLQVLQEGVVGVVQVQQRHDQGFQLCQLQ